MDYQCEYPTKEQMKELDRIPGLRWRSGNMPSQGAADRLRCRYLNYDTEMSKLCQSGQKGLGGLLSYSVFRDTVAKAFGYSFKWEQEDL